MFILSCNKLLNSGALQKFVMDVNGEEESTPQAKHDEPSPMEEEEHNTGNKQLFLIFLVHFRSL